MPYSSTLFDKTIKNIVRQLKPKSCLDIGAGAGKYGLIIKDIIKDTKDTKIIGVEVEKDYISKFNLKKIYNEIRCCNASNFINKKSIEEKYDLVIMGDVVEHMKKSDGVDLINFLIYRSKYILILYPKKYLQNSIDGYEHEAHISVWEENDFVNFEHTKIIKKEDQNWETKINNVYMIDPHTRVVTQDRHFEKLFKNGSHPIIHATEKTLCLHEPYHFHLKYFNKSPYPNYALNFLPKRFTYKDVKPYLRKLPFVLPSDIQESLDLVEWDKLKIKKTEYYKAYKSKRIKFLDPKMALLHPKDKE